MSDNALPVIALIGGTGDLGSGLARLWSKAGYQVIVGSRTAEKAGQSAQELKAEGYATIRGATNADAVAHGDVIVLAVPFSNLAPTLAEIRDAVRNKIVVTTMVPLVPPKVSVVSLPDSGSAAVAAQAMLDPSSRLVSAFHNVGAWKLQSGEKAECDVLVFSDDAAARAEVMTLAGLVGTRGIDGGALINSVAAEALTSILININRKYKVKGAGISITGLSLT
jgi:8-hydroxy-5-deazaflavin:NADPH oxidoreductase